MLQIEQIQLDYNFLELLQVDYIQQADFMKYKAGGLIFKRSESQLMDLEKMSKQKDGERISGEVSQQMSDLSPQLISLSPISN